MDPIAPQAMGQQLGRRSWAKPCKIKMVEPIRRIPRPACGQALREAGYNRFLLRSEDVCIDLLTNSRTSTMSGRQWAGITLGDEAHASSRNFHRPEEAVRRYYGYTTWCRPTRDAAPNTRSAEWPFDPDSKSPATCTSPALA